MHDNSSITCVQVSLLKFILYPTLSASLRRNHQQMAVKQISASLQALNTNAGRQSRGSRCAVLYAMLMRRCAGNTVQCLSMMSKYGATVSTERFVWIQTGGPYFSGCMSMWFAFKHARSLDRFSARWARMTKLEVAVLYAALMRRCAGDAVCNAY